MSEEAKIEAEKRYPFQYDNGLTYPVGAINKAKVACFVEGDEFGYNRAKKEYEAKIKELEDKLGFTSNDPMLGLGRSGEQREKM